MFSAWFGFTETLFFSQLTTYNTRYYSTYYYTDILFICTFCKHSQLPSSHPACYSHGLLVRSAVPSSPQSCFQQCPRIVPRDFLLRNRPNAVDTIKPPNVSVA
jgi:hypothetical protein